MYHQSPPTTNTQFINFRTWHSPECPITNNNGDSTRHPVVRLLASGAVDRTCPIYELEALERWARIHNTWPHDHQPINWNLVDSVNRRRQTPKRQKGKQPRYVTESDFRLNQIRDHGFLNGNDNDGHRSNGYDSDDYDSDGYDSDEEMQPLMTRVINFRRGAAEQSLIGPNIPALLSHYWHHHPYTEEDRAAGIPPPRNFGALAAPETYADYRLYMADLLLSRGNQSVPSWARKYWTAHPINRDRVDEPNVVRAFAYHISERLRRRMRD